MGFFGNIVGAVVKAAVTPVAVVVDVVNVATGDEPEATKSVVESSVEDIKDALDDLCDGDL